MLGAAPGQLVLLIRINYASSGCDIEEAAGSLSSQAWKPPKKSTRECRISSGSGGQFGPSLRRSAGCDALIAWRYSVQLQKSALMLLILVDYDGDGIGNNKDNCAFTANSTQLDSDGDGIRGTCVRNSGGWWKRGMRARPAPGVPCGQVAG